MTEAECGALVAVSRITMDELRSRLSALVDEAARGARIVITRRGKDVALLGPAENEHTHRGRRFGKSAFKAAVEKDMDGRYLQVLAEDRRSETR